MTRSAGTLSRAVGVLLVVASIAYPFAVWWSLERWSPRYLVTLLALLWLGRVLVARQRSVATVAPAAAALLFCAAVASVDAPWLLVWYPVLINAALFLVFGASLFRTPAIESLARLRTPELPPAAVLYTRQVTRVWTLFFLLNGTLAAALACWAPLSWWTLYNGLIAYGLMGLLLGGEWLIRQRMVTA